MSVSNLDSVSGTGLNLTSEVTVRTYTALSDGYISGRLLLSSLNGAAATITVKVQLLDSSDNKLGVPVSYSFAKDAAADTRAAAMWGPIRVLTGQKLRVRALSTNASDTAAAWASLMDDADVAASSTPQTGDVFAQLPTNFVELAISGSGAVTAGTVSDKTGYSLTQSFPSNFASLGINASGHVSRVTLVDTTTNLTNGALVFTGARAVTITVNDNAGTPAPISGALVRVTQSGSSELKQTNASGVVTFSLNDGSYTLSITNGAGYSYTPETITVSSGSVSFTKTMTINSVTTPSSGQCTGTLLVLDPNGAPESGVTVYFQAAGTNADGYAYDSTITSSTSNGSGYVTRLFPSGSIPYRYRRGTTGNWVPFTTSATSGGSFTITSSVGRP